MSASPSLVIGWREWVALPGLGVDRVKAKVDTGARSSALHAFDIRYRERAGRTWVYFSVHPVQKDPDTTVDCKAPLLEHRSVRSSNGKHEMRPVIRTGLTLDAQTWDIDLTLTSRDAMGFRMLLGREAVRRRAVVDPGRSYLLSAEVAKEERARKRKKKAKKKKKKKRAHKASTENRGKKRGTS